MAEIRITFSKRERAKYISHLDLNRAMQRALKRAGIPIWYTEGFNPHAYIMFPLALSLGVESDCELMDIRIESEVDFEQIKQSLNEALPSGLVVNNVALQKKKHTEIAFSEYKISIISDVSAKDLSDKFTQFLSLETIETQKRSKKKGLQTVDIKPMIEVSDIIVDGDKLNVTMILPSGVSSTLNPSLVIDTFSEKMTVNLTSVSIERTKIMCENGEIFS